MTTQPVLEIKDLSKGFVLHNQGAAQIEVFSALNLRVAPGECIVLAGRSGVGKSTLMRAIYGNYLSHSGQILIRDGDQAYDVRTIQPRLLTQLRRTHMGYVSQFLRVIPRVTTLSLVMEPMLIRGVCEIEAETKAKDLLYRLNLPEGHWDLPPATFSGGEQQRVNIAHGFAVDYPIMLLDEPTASLDGDNKKEVIDLIQSRLASGAAVIGIFHDMEVRQALDAREFDISEYKPSTSS